MTTAESSPAAVENTHGFSMSEGLMPGVCHDLHIMMNQGMFPMRRTVWLDEQFFKAD